MLRMYTLCLAGILGLGLAATGCGPGRHGSQQFYASWSLELAGVVGWVGCGEAGVGEVDLDVQNVVTGTDYHALFPCSDYGGTSQVLPVGDYSVALRAYDTTGPTKLQVSEWVAPTTYPIDIGVVTPLPDVVLPI